jgi:hypothetical protein
MNPPPIDNASAGFVFVYDAKTGEVVWTHEKLVEVVRGRGECPARITEPEREQIRAEAARVFPDRKIEALIAPDGFALSENAKISIDPRTRVLREEPAETRSLAERLRDFGKQTP